MTVISFYWRLPFCFNLDKEHRPAPSSGNKDLKHGKNGFDLAPEPVFWPGLNLYCVVYRAKLTVFGSVFFSDTLYDEKRKFWSNFRWFCDSLSVLERELILQSWPQSPFGKKVLFEKSVFILQDWLWSRDIYWCSRVNHLTISQYLSVFHQIRFQTEFPEP